MRSAPAYPEDLLLLFLLGTLAALRRGWPAASTELSRIADRTLGRRPSLFSHQIRWSQEVAKNMRVRVAASLMVSVLTMLGAADAVAADRNEVRYACDFGQRLIISRSDNRASVQFIDRTYELERRPSSIGEKYGSADAALIIDGQSAVFVAEDRLQLGACNEATHMASSN